MQLAQTISTMFLLEYREPVPVDFPSGERTRGQSMTKMRLLSSAFGAISISMLVAGIARAEIHTEYVDYQHGDTILSGYLAYDDSIEGRRPGVLLVHHRDGLDEETLESARLIAEMGYVVLAADMFGKGVLPQTVPEMQALTGVFNNDRMLTRARAQAGLDWLTGNSMVDDTRLAAIGYCFGGNVAIELAESGADLDGVIPVHGSFRNLVPENARNIQGQVLILHGAEDDVAPLDVVNSLIGDFRAAEVDWQLELYSGATHGFTAPQGAAEERADREYKAAIERFFAEIFEP
jgi:dienelactone hydrolase